MNTYFARQPILNADQELYGYELLFRPNPDVQISTADGNVLFDGNMATMSVLQAFHSGGFGAVTGGKKAFVNFTEKLLLDRTATIFPKEYLTVEILEDTEPTAELLSAVRELKTLGYTIALDDFIYKKELKPLVELADIIKVEVNGREECIRNLMRILHEVDPEKCTILAEKVESKAMFDACVQAGCKLFQGYFFAKPVTVSEPQLGILKTSYLQLLTQVSRAQLDFEEIAAIIRRDVSLSFKILNLANSAFFSAGGSEITDIHKALVRLGETELKRWISFVTMSTLCVDKPSELVQMSLVRAQFCEEVAGLIGHYAEREAFFLTGMFSLLDALMDSQMEDILTNVKIPGLTHDALVGVQNKAADVLKLILAIEQGEWATAQAFTDKLQCSYDEVMDKYLTALQWTGSLSEP